MTHLFNQYSKVDASIKEHETALNNMAKWTNLTSKDHKEIQLERVLMAKAKEKKLQLIDCIIQQLEKEKVEMLNTIKAA